MSETLLHEMNWFNKTIDYSFPPPQFLLFLTPICFCTVLLLLLFSLFFLAHLQRSLLSSHLLSHGYALAFLIHHSPLCLSAFAHVFISYTPSVDIHF